MIITITIELDVDKALWAVTNEVADVETSARRWARRALAGSAPIPPIGLRSVRLLKRGPVRPRELVYTGQCQWCASGIASTTGDDGSWYATDEEGAVGFTVCPDSSTDEHEPIGTH